LFAFAYLWFFALALRMGAPAIEFVLHEKPQWLVWVYLLPRVWPEHENARWRDYWPMLMPLTVAVAAGALQAIDGLKAKREEQIYHHENHN
jgi:hypothetical protein